MLKITNYTKKYGDFVAVDNLSLTVEKGDIFGFIGHNGAGKTTTIKSVVGILEFESGNIMIDNISIKDEPIECKKKMAYIPDNPDLYETLTGIAYLNFISDIYEINSEKRRTLIENFANKFDFLDQLGNPINSYSHGMKQKLAIISALIRQPKLMVLDEPFVGLDPKAAHMLKETMKEMCENGCSIFFSTHVLEVAEKLCNRVAIIKGGKIVMNGTMEEIKGNKSLEDVFLELVNE